MQRFYIHSQHFFGGVHGPTWSQENLSIHTSKGWPDRCYHFCTHRSNDLEQGIVDLSSRSEPQKTSGNSGSESLTNDLGLIGSRRCTKHCASELQSSSKMIVHQDLLKIMMLYVIDCQSVMMFYFIKKSQCFANTVVLPIPPCTKKSGELLSVPRSRLYGYRLSTVHWEAEPKRPSIQGTKIRWKSLGANRNVWDLCTNGAMICFNAKYLLFALCHGHPNQTVCNSLSTPSTTCAVAWFKEHSR